MPSSDFTQVPGGVAAARGFKAAGANAGIKHTDRNDIALIYADNDCAAAGVFTNNTIKAAPLLLDIKRLSSGRARVVVANSGNANACNGERGMADALAMTAETARLLGIPDETVLVASTGVIGQAMPMDKVRAGIGRAVAALSRSGGSDAAGAIMTTDKMMKQYAVSFDLDGATVTVGGMAKGSGMIHPDMATMLCFITTDAAISPACLKDSLASAVDASFNMISVDRDTSTNDMAVVLAGGAAGNREITGPGRDFDLFQDALSRVCVNLARMIARDGEGATKLIEVRVVNARTVKDARLAARSVVSSNLFKAAVYGKDANWGRILAAAGYSGASFDPLGVDVFLGDVQVAGNGSGLAFDEEAALEVLSADTVRVLLDFNDGPHGATAWGCDLTHEYVSINGSYRT